MVGKTKCYLCWLFKRRKEESMIFLLKEKVIFQGCFVKWLSVDEVDDQIQTVTCHCVCASYSRRETLGSF